MITEKFGRGLKTRFPSKLVLRCSKNNKLQMMKVVILLL